MEQFEIRILTGAENFIFKCQRFICSIRIFQLISSETHLEIVMKDIFDAVVLQTKPWIAVEARTLFRGLLRDILPCGDAHQAFHVLTETACGDSGHPIRFAAYIFAVGICFFSLYLLCFLLLIINSLNILKI